jgi:hypothetical protein
VPESCIELLGGAVCHHHQPQHREEAQMSMCIRIAKRARAFPLNLLIAGGYDDRGHVTIPIVAALAAR